jgi:dimethylaniline monooxygenase (N-oxide forming)
MKRFAVIGAGAGGLCAAKNLLARGIEVTIFEIGSKIGGLWVYENDSGMSPAYRSLHINSEARVSSFGDFPLPEDEGLYPDHREMHRYFERYAKHFDLTRRIRFSSRVEAIEPRDGSFNLRLESGQEEVFDGVVVATGHQSVPRHPPEVAAFTGEYLHAHSYRVPEPFAGKRVLVIGPGNSGVDIAADICTVTERTALCARSPVLIMPRMMFGVPNSRILGLVEKPWVPMRIRIWFRSMLTRMFHGSMEQWGFRTPMGRTHPISHPTLISHIAWKRIAVKPGISGIEGQEVRFVDGTAERFDSIIAATGYRTEFPYLPEKHMPLAGTRLALYNRVCHPSLPGLYFVGFFDVSGGSNIRMMDDQSEYVAAVASGAVTLPGRDAMLAAIADDHAWAEKQFPHSPRYGLELDPRHYRKGLARDYARAGMARPADAPPAPQPATAARG